MQGMLITGLPVNRSWTVLDAGCGKGDDTLYFSSVANDVVGVDIQPSNTWPREDNIHFVICDILRLPFRESSFDLVTAKDVLHHLNRERVSEALAELQRVTARDGFLRVIEANRYHINSILIYKENPAHNHFSKEEFCHLMGPGDYSGFELLPWLYKFHYSELPWYVFVIALKLITKIPIIFKAILYVLNEKEKHVPNLVTYFIWTRKK